MTTYTEFFDIIGANFSRVPLVRGTVRAIYLTGSGGIEESAAQIAAAKADGVGLITIDQTPGLGVFRAGNARFGDIEYLAGTDVSAASAVAERRSLGLTEHGLYGSESILPGLESAVGNLAGVELWVANYGYSAASAQARLAANPLWKAVQFGDPASNAYTLIPGTSMNLAQGQADIDIASTGWLAQFLPGVPPPAPALVPAPATAPAWPFGPLAYLDTPRADPDCHSGYYSAVDHHVVATWQSRMKFRGWTIPVTGDFDAATEAVALAFQAEKGLVKDGKVGPLTWSASWTLPIT